MGRVIGVLALLALAVWGIAHQGWLQGTPSAVPQRTADGGRVSIVGPRPIPSPSAIVRGDGNLRLGPGNPGGVPAPVKRPATRAAGPLLRRLSGLTGVPAARLRAFGPHGTAWRNLWRGLRRALGW